MACYLTLHHVILCWQINKKVMGMIEKAETEYKELIHKKKVKMCTGSLLNVKRHAEWKPLLFKLAFKMSDQEISRIILYTGDIGCVDCVQLG